MGCKNLIEIEELTKIKNENLTKFYEYFFILIECYKELRIIGNCVNCVKDSEEVEKCSKSNGLFNFINNFISVLKRTYSENKEIYPILINLFDNMLREVKVVEKLKCKKK